MSQLTFFEFERPRASESPLPQQIGYGRARLWLGITAVGTIVTVASIGLFVRISDSYERLTSSLHWGPSMSLIGFTLLYAAIQLPFDVLGGFLLPRRFHRLHPSLSTFIFELVRGVAAHVGILSLTAIATTLAGRFGGLPLTVASSLVLMYLQLVGRRKLAAIIAPLKYKSAESHRSTAVGTVPIVYVENRDEGFTGGVAGVIRPTGLIIPRKWRDLLKPAELDFASKRRAIAIETGSWQRGRAAAIGFTLTGVTIACLLTGQDRLGTVGGTIDLSLWFTLWSFFGLLVLPTFSRRAIMEIDQLACLGGVDSSVMRSTTRRLNELQDGEEQRPGFVEVIFHPIPSVENRLRSQPRRGSTGYWDVARTSVYLSLSGLGLLSRAVHCNCGRPSLWVFLPVD